MSDAERHAYDEHINAIMIQNDVLGNAKLEGLAEGRAEGRVEGRAEGRAEEKKAIARNLLSQNIPLEIISQATGLSIEDIRLCHPHS